MDPETFSRRRGDLRRLRHDDELVVLDILHHLADVNVRVALGPYFLAVISKSPLVSPQRFRFLDRGRPKARPRRRRHVMQMMEASSHERAAKPASDSASVD